MPIYEYRCDSCSYQFEVKQSMKDDALTTCERCGKSHSPPHLLVGPHVQGERLVCDRLFEQDEAAVRRRENTSRGRREERAAAGSSGAPAASPASPSTAPASGSSSSAPPAASPSTPNTSNTSNK